MRLHFVRHGQSTWNVEKRVQGQTPHPPLTETGRADAHRAADVLLDRLGTEHSGIQIWTSDAVRAQQTAAIIAARLKLPVIESPALREQFMGDLEGKLTSDLRPEAPPVGQHISEVRWDGGESIEDVYARMSEFLTTLTSEAIIVSHGHSIQVALAAVEGRSHRDVEWRHIANGEVITVEMQLPCAL